MSVPRVAYFCMEMAIDPSLKIYSGGLGFLAGSHMRSAYDLDLPMVGVSMLWTKGYGDQRITDENTITLDYVDRTYPFLTDTGIVVEVPIFGQNVKIKAYRLEAGHFNTVPIYLLSTNIPENTPEQRKLTDVLYAGDQETRVAQEIILGRGGYKVLEAAGELYDVLHINEGHAVPALFEMLDAHGGNLDAMREKCVFTTHTPVPAGNEVHPMELLHRAGFFANTPPERAYELGGEPFSLTVAALRMCRLANGVSKLHGQVANQMWAWVTNRCPIISITNAVSREYWQDERIKQALEQGSDDALLSAKHQLKAELCKVVNEQPGKDFDPNKLTLVWARRFTPYKRATLIFRDLDRLKQLMKTDQVQIVFAGKYHPNDELGREMFNTCLATSKDESSMAVMLNYDLALSGLLKRGSDIWLNTPIVPLEASGTSGMSANLNGTLHCTTHDGWAVEGTFDDINGYVINPNPFGTRSTQECLDWSHVPESINEADYESMMSIIESRALPTYKNHKQRWATLMRNAINASEAYFDSNRMVLEYYTHLYRPLGPS